MAALMAAYPELVDRRPLSFFWCCFLEKSNRLFGSRVWKALGGTRGCMCVHSLTSMLDCRSAPTRFIGQTRDWKGHWVTQKCL
jgi:hypothetical protein